MNVNEEKLNKIFDKTRGKCHLCHKQLAFFNYGIVGAKSAWEIEHSKPKSRGGSDHLNNLYAACITCNREKGNGTNYSVRSKNGVRKAPLPENSRRKAVIANTAKGALAGAAIGRLLGPGGIIIGGAIGALVGNEADPDE